MAGYRYAPFRLATKLPPLGVPSGSSVVLVGDGWGAGIGASAPALGFAPRVAQRFDWRLTNASLAGAAYVKQAHSSAATFEDILRGVNSTNVKLLIIEGGLGDQADASITALDHAVQATFAAAKPRFGQVVVIGPCQNTPGLPNQTLANIDYTLNTYATRDRFYYLSCLGEGWINNFNVAELIGKPVEYFPNDAGYGELAARFERDIARLSSTDVVP